MAARPRLKGEKMHWCIGRRPDKADPLLRKI